VVCSQTNSPAYRMYFLDNGSVLFSVVAIYAIRFNIIIFCILLIEYVDGFRIILRLDGYYLPKKH
jgi:hypothetical protein